MSVRRKKSVSSTTPPDRTTAQPAAGARRPPNRPPRYSSEGLRETWYHPHPALPELQNIGRDEFRIAKGLGTHAHDEAMELCYIERGTVRWWAGPEVFDVTGGEVYLTWPDEPHGGIDDALHPCKLYWLGLWFPAAPPKNYLGLPTDEGAALHAALKTVPHRHFPAPVQVARLYDRIFDLLQPAIPATSGVGVPEPQPSAVTAAALRATFVNLIAMLLQAGQAAHHRAYSLAITQAIAIMDRNLTRPLKLPVIAEQVGLSTSHFKARFRRETGLTPGEFSLRRRVALAREKILDSDRPLLDIALDLGFSSSQYLATCFKRITGKSPSDLRHEHTA